MMQVLGAATTSMLLQRPLASEPSQGVNVSGLSEHTTKEEEQAAKQDGPVGIRGGSAGSTEKSALEREARAKAAEVTAVIAQLRARDREVRAHEMAHVAAAGGYVTSGPHYTYQKGPDGRQYAIGGEVGIDVSPERGPEATIRKMQIVQQAALAPANPSAQDMRVAAAAAQAMMEAMQALRQQDQKDSGDEVGGQTTQQPASSKGDQGRRLENGKGASENDAAVLAAQSEQLHWQQRLRMQVAVS